MLPLRTPLPPAQAVAAQRTLPSPRGRAVAALIGACACALHLPALGQEAASAPGAEAPASAPAPATVFELPAERALPVMITLLPRGLRSGRDEPLLHRFRPLVQFSGDASPVSCVLLLPDPESQIAPGQTRPATLRCVLPVRLRADQPDFQLKEGSRVIGAGSLRLPAAPAPAQVP
ncbi:MAG: hypothetical protein CFE46_07180 [Burkholderiales bacterium PBB6]|nr:MAG: hypothetical protein CFE46_07180 [Burkholderiales bacterium PBB6]